MSDPIDAAALRELRDIEEIRKLKSRYIEACDGGWGGRASHDADTIASLFTEDCEWDGGVFGNRQGREALRDYYRAIRPEDNPSAFHILTSPIIEVDGDEATGSWHLTIVLTLRDGSSQLLGGVFSDCYRRTGEGWRIHGSHFTRAVAGQYDRPWEFIGA